MFSGLLLCLLGVFLVNGTEMRRFKLTEVSDSVLPLKHWKFHVDSNYFLFLCCGFE